MQSKEWVTLLQPITLKSLTSYLHDMYNAAIQCASEYKNVHIIIITLTTTQTAFGMDIVRRFAVRAHIRRLAAVLHQSLDTSAPFSLSGKFEGWTLSTNALGGI